MQEIKSSKSRFWNIIDNIDRYLYGRKMKNFLIGSICVLLIAPLLDWLLEVPYDRLTWLSTFSFMLYVLLIILAWISAWQDDIGKWTWQRAKSRLITYYETFKDTLSEARAHSKDELLYKTGFRFFLGAIGWKSLQNLSVFVRKPIQKLTGHTMIRFIHFERFTRHWFWVPLFIAAVIFIYLWQTDRQVLRRWLKDMLHYFRNSRNEHAAASLNIKAPSGDHLVIDSKRQDHLDGITINGESDLFARFTQALQAWDPGTCKYEYQYQDKLYRHLKKMLPQAVIELEYPIGNAADGNKGRADIVIDETILIEMKKDTSSGAVQRAQGQIGQYSNIWGSRGPVVLLLCNYEYEFARLKFSTTMSDMLRLERSVVTLVAT